MAPLFFNKFALLSSHFFPLVSTNNLHLQLKSQSNGVPFHEGVDGGVDLGMDIRNWKLDLNIDIKKEHGNTLEAGERKTLQHVYAT